MPGHLGVGDMLYLPGQRFLVCFLQIGLRVGQSISGVCACAYDVSAGSCILCSTIFYTIQTTPATEAKPGAFLTSSMIL